MPSQISGLPTVERDFAPGEQSGQRRNDNARLNSMTLTRQRHARAPSAAAPSLKAHLVRADHYYITQKEIIRTVERIPMQISIRPTTEINLVCFRRRLVPPAHLPS